MGQGFEHMKVDTGIHSSVPMLVTTQNLEKCFCRAALSSEPILSSPSGVRSSLGWQLIFKEVTPVLHVPLPLMSVGWSWLRQQEQLQRLLGNVPLFVATWCPPQYQRVLVLREEGRGAHGGLGGVTTPAPAGPGSQGRGFSSKKHLTLFPTLRSPRGRS